MLFENFIILGKIAAKGVRGEGRSSSVCALSEIRTMFLNKIYCFKISYLLGSRFTGFIFWCNVARFIFSG